MEFDERPPPPGSEFAQRVAYVVLALSLFVTIAFPIFIVVMFVRLFSVGS